MVVVVVVVGSGDEREKGSLVEGGVVCMKEWKRRTKSKFEEGRKVGERKHIGGERK